jgi:RHS repeat-associated protein
MVAAFDGGVYSNHWFWQDGRGNTSHITGDNAYLFERYTYDLSGAPKFYDEWGNERFGGSAYDTRFLFGGSKYLPDAGLYEMRNRFYQIALNRFLQTDPIGFAGDALNLHRYCGNDPVNHMDSSGLDYDHDGRGDSDYAFDVRYDNQDDLLGWEAASYMRDVFARNDDASQRFSEYSAKLYDLYHREFSMGFTASGESVAGDSQITITRFQLSHEHRRLWYIFHRGLVSWEYVLTDGLGNPVRGIHINETIQYTNGHYFFPLNTMTKPGVSDQNGHLGDNYGATFFSPEGYVTVTQTLTIQGVGEVQFAGVLRADGTYTTDIMSGIFH